MRMAGRITPADGPRLCEELAAKLGRAGTREAADGDVICDVGGLTQVNLAVVDVLARLQLTARRLGGRLRLHGAPPELLALLVLVGLDEVA